MRKYGQAYTVGIHTFFSKKKKNTSKRTNGLTQLSKNLHILTLLL